MIETKMISRYEPSSNFREVFAKIMGVTATQKSHDLILKSLWVETPLGPMIAVADEKALYLLEFIDYHRLEREMKRLRETTKSTIILGTTEPLLSIQAELTAYFAGKLQHFKTPLHLLGSSFQKSVWEALKNIPHGETRSYQEIARAIGKPTAFRATALANAANQIAIVIPCHRVIQSNGKLGGYAGGITRKEWLISHEKLRKK